MPKPKPPAPVGRPTFGDQRMTRHQVILDEETVEKARELGDGNLSAGIRRKFRARQTGKYTK